MIVDNSIYFDRNIYETSRKNTKIIFETNRIPCVFDTVADETILYINNHKRRKHMRYVRAKLAEKVEMVCTLANV